VVLDESGGPVEGGGAFFEEGRLVNPVHKISDYLHTPDNIGKCREYKP
jgi:hypothetical protein